MRRSLLVATGAFAAPSLLATDQSTDPHSWALLSDTHIAADRGRVLRGVEMARHFEQVSAELLGLRRYPAGVLISGDLALNSGETGDYSALRDLLQPLRAEGYPVHLALGNHDHRERFLVAFAELAKAARPVSTHVVSLLRAQRANWILLDTLEVTAATPGLLGGAQLAWLAKVLDHHKDKPAIIVLHHNLDARNGSLALKDTQQFLDTIRPRRQVKACVFGHTHVWRTWQDESGIQCVNLPPVAYVFKEGDPSGWVQATLERHGMKLELRCIDRSHPAHGQLVNLDWRKA